MIQHHEQVSPSAVTAKPRRARKGKRTGQSTRTWKEYPEEMLAILDRAGEKEFVALDGVTHREAHSFRMRMMKMQAAFVRYETKTPERVVALAKTVMWTMRQTGGHDKWQLVGRPRGLAEGGSKDDTMTAIVAKLPKDWRRRLEELVK